MAKSFASPPGVPVGTIISYFGATAPDGYLVCDGSYKNQADYPALAARLTSAEFNGKYGTAGTTTFQLPDLRGEFLRGTGTNSHTNQGSGLSVGQHQDGTRHVVIINDHYYDNIVLDWIQSSDYEFVREADSIYKDASTKGAKWITMNTDPNNTNITSTYSSRPTNTSVLYCIKY